jgi:hypothetical protein
MSRHRRSQPDRYDENRAAALPGAAPSLPRHRAGHSGHSGQLVGFGFPPAEWDLLTHLPAQVVIAAISAEVDTARHTVVEGLAGIEAIAGGRAFDSELVRAVVAAIFAEPDEVDGPPAAGPVRQEFADRSRGIVDVLTTCRSATALLAARADPADSAAYRQWLQSIAARVCAAAHPVAGGEWFDNAGRRFVDDLGTALSLA